MKNNTPIKMTEDEALELLPWYLNGSLSEAETLEFDSLLKVSSKLKESLRVEDEVLHLVKEELAFLEVSKQAVIDDRLGKVFDVIERESQSETKLKADNPRKSWFRMLFPSGIVNMQYATFAVVSILSLTLLFAFITPLVVKTNVYYPATIETAANQKTKNVTIMLVGLSTEKNDPQLLKILEKMEATIDSIPGKDGMFRIRYRKKLDANQTKKSVEILSAHKELIWFVGEDY